MPTQLLSRHSRSRSALLCKQTCFHFLIPKINVIFTFISVSISTSTNKIMRERQRADRLHYAYLRRGVSHDYPFQPQVIPGTTLLRVDEHGYLAMNENGDLLLRTTSNKELHLPTTYCYHSHDDAYQKLLVSVARHHLVEQNPETANLFHPSIHYAPSIEMLDRYFQLLYHPRINESVREKQQQQRRRRRL